MSLFDKGWTSDDGEQLFAVGWLEGQITTRIIVSGGGSSAPPAVIKKRRTPKPQAKTAKEKEDLDILDVIDIVGSYLTIR